MKDLIYFQFKHNPLKKNCYSSPNLQMIVGLDTITIKQEYINKIKQHYMKKWNNLGSKRPLDNEWYLCSDGTMHKVLMWSDEADSFINEGYKYDRFIWFMNLPELPE